MSLFICKMPSSLSPGYKRDHTTLQEQVFLSPPLPRLNGSSAESCWSRAEELRVWWGQCKSHQLLQIYEFSLLRQGVVVACLCALSPSQLQVETFKLKLPWTAPLIPHCRFQVNSTYPLQVTALCTFQKNITQRSSSSFPFSLHPHIQNSPSRWKAKKKVCDGCHQHCLTQLSWQQPKTMVALSDIHSSMNKIASQQF